MILCQHGAQKMGMKIIPSVGAVMLGVAAHKCTQMCSFVYTIPYRNKHMTTLLQGVEDSYDPLSCRSFSTIEPLDIGHFSGK